MAAAREQGGRGVLVRVLAMRAAAAAEGYYPCMVVQALKQRRACAEAEGRQPRVNVLASIG